MGLTKKPEKPKAPKPIAPAPTVSETLPAEEATARKQTQLTGYKKQVVAGSLTPYKGGKTTFG